MRRFISLFALSAPLLVASCGGPDPAAPMPTSAVTITTTSLPAGTQGAAYSQQLTATGGDGSFTWSVTGGALPTGITLDAAGLISGTPTAVESESFTVRAESGGQSSTQALTIDIVDDAAAGVIVAESGGGSAVSEAGTSDTLSVVLASQPISDVVLSVSSANTGEVTVAPATMTFTNANWDAPQSLVVTGVDDATTDGDQAVTVTVAVVDGSSDDVYDPVGDETVSVTNADDDSAPPSLGWTWIAGDSVINQNASYGTIDIGDPSNVPGARNDQAAWVEDDGDVWVFGGEGYDDVGGFGHLNDLWRFDGTNWTWAAGSSTVDQFGVYGPQGVPGSAYTPGGREEMATAIAPNGDLWLFGGVGWGSSTTGHLNDLWRFDGSSWIYEEGNAPNADGRYGTKGVPHALNRPGGRRGATMWVDLSGDVWVFGGYGYDDASPGWGHLNDLWRYDGTDWTWVSGSSVQNQLGTYGTQGVSDAANTPGARANSVSWIDEGGDFWLYSGTGFNSLAQSTLSDLWHFDGLTWTWVSGSATGPELDSHGTLGVPSASNTPGVRLGATTWTDSTGDLWMFGGAYRNDLWRHDGSVWTWMGGDQTLREVPVHGTLGVSAPGNSIGGRATAVGGIDGAGNVWVFGGTAYGNSGLGRFNDLWRLVN